MCGWLCGKCRGHLCCSGHKLNRVYWVSQPLRDDTIEQRICTWTWHLPCFGKALQLRFHLYSPILRRSDSKWWSQWPQITCFSSQGFDQDFVLIFPIIWQSELPAKLLNYCLWSNRSNINQCQISIVYLGVYPNSNKSLRVLHNTLTMEYCVYKSPDFSPVTSRFLRFLQETVRVAWRRNAEFMSLNRLYICQNSRFRIALLVDLLDTHHYGRL